MLEFVFSFSVSVEMITQFVSFSLLGLVNFYHGLQSMQAVTACSVLSCSTKAGHGAGFHPENGVCQSLFYSLTSTVMFSIAFLLLTLGLICSFSVVEAEVTDLRPLFYNPVT